MDATLTIYRPWVLARRLREYRVVVDGAETIPLKNGESTVLTLPPGPHSLALRQGSTVSRPIDLTLSPGEKRELVCAADSGGSLMDSLDSLLGRPCDCLRLLGDDSPQGRYLLAAAKQGVQSSGLEELGPARFVIFPVIAAGVVNLITPPDQDFPTRLALFAGAAIGSALIFFIYRDRPVTVDGVELRRVARPTLLSRAVWFLPLVLGLGFVAGLLAGVRGGDGGFTKLRENFMLGLRLSSGFVQSCPANCEKANPRLTTCPAYCDCMTEALFRGGSDIDVPKLYKSRESGVPDVESERKYLALHERCGAQALALAMGGK